MTQVCTRCGSPCDEAGARFCPRCGGALAAPSEAAAGEAAAALPAARCAVHAERDAAFTCSRCGSFACAACRHLGPDGAELCPACLERVKAAAWRVPWEQRAELGLWQAYWQTAKAGTFHPNFVYEGLRPREGIWDPLSFGLLSCVVSMTSTVLLYAAIGAVGAFVALQDKAGGDAAKGLGIGLAVAVGVAVAIPLLGLLRIGVGTLIDHICLLISGGGKEGLGATLRGYCYSLAPAMWGLIPVCGTYIWEIWRMVAAVYAYKGVHRMSGTRAALAVVAPLLLCCGGYMLSVAVISAFEPAHGR